MSFFADGIHMMGIFPDRFFSGIPPNQYPYHILHLRGSEIQARYDIYPCPPALPPIGLSTELDAMGEKQYIWTV